MNDGGVCGAAPGFAGSANNLSENWHFQQFSVIYDECSIFQI